MAVFRVVEAFAMQDKASGAVRLFRPGDLVDAHDPVVRGRESLFEPVEETVRRSIESQVAQVVHGAPGVEQATAAPGEKRSVSKPKPARDEGD